MARSTTPKGKAKLLTLPATVRLTDRVVEVLATVQEQYDDQRNDEGERVRFTGTQPTLHATATGLHIYIGRHAREFG